MTTAVGGEPVSKTVEGRERYPINIRYSRDFRNDIASLKHVLVATDKGAQIPMGEVAEIEMVSGPAMLRNENGMLSSYVYVDIAGRDIDSYAKRQNTQALQMRVPM